MFKQYAQKTLGIPEENIKFFENAGSTVMRREIAKLSKMVQMMEGKAEVIFYYAGHGFPYENTTIRDSFINHFKKN